MDTCERCKRQRASVRERWINANAEFDARLRSEAAANGASMFARPDVHLMPYAARICSECEMRAEDGGHAVDRLLDVIREAAGGEGA
jgi:hypothetical protein